ncbi:MAG TPA: PEP-CTERM sorting domain-containing protein [Chthoniobacteraceae bacterium]|nr:PEP-CTERM sorting domain-containing protein [Chthoniobacteraceae bacterium]
MKHPSFLNRWGRLSLACLLFGLAVPCARAATYTWVGPGAGWSTAAHWTPGGFPVGGSTSSSTVLVFQSSETAYASTDNVTAAFVLNRFIFEPGTGTALTTISNGNTADSNRPITFAADGEVGPAIVQNSDGAFRVQGNGRISLSDDLTLTGTGTGLVTIATIVTGSKAIIVDGGAAFALTGANLHTGGTVVKNGTLQVGTGSASILGSGALTLEGGRISSVSVNTRTLSNEVNVATGAEVAFGDTVNTGLLIFSAGATIGDHATLKATSGLTFSGAFTTGSNLTLAPEAGATLTLSSLDIEGGVTLDLQPGGSPVVITGALSNSGTAKLNFNLAGGEAGEVYTLLEFGSTTLGYGDLNLLNGNDRLDTSFGVNGWLIENGTIQVALIPEPSTAGMLLTVLGLAGAGARWRSRRTRFTRTATTNALFS